MFAGKLIPLFSANNPNFKMRSHSVLLISLLGLFETAVMAFEIWALMEMGYETSATSVMLILSVFMFSFSDLCNIYALFECGSPSGIVWVKSFAFGLGTVLLMPCLLLAEGTTFVAVVCAVYAVVIALGTFAIYQVFFSTLPTPPPVEALATEKTPCLTPSSA